MQNETFYKDLINNLFDGVYFVNRDRVITFWNKGAERITGYDSDYVLGHACRDNLLNHVTETGVELCNIDCPLAKTLKDGKTRELEAFLHHADGHRVPVSLQVSPIKDETGAIIGAVENFSNNLKRYSLRQEVYELRQKVLVDPLTGIRNRLFLEGRLEASITEFNHTHAAIGLLFIDIDYFKHFNDSFGHDVGDLVLKMVANTLKDNLRDTDVIGRWGGEEFLAILYDFTSQDQLLAIAEKLRAMVECSRLDIDATGKTVTISVGATLLNSEDTVKTFVQRADNLMYQSKRDGRNRVSVG